ncbi:ubiquitin carboxyl-terminal hydrolase 1 [Polypterus senegalus]
MPGLMQSDANGATKAKPVKNRLSLKFFQKKETKRTLDLSDSQEEEHKPSESVLAESSDQVVPAPPPPASPHTYEKRENLVPFVGLNNLGNTCYLNSILQVLYYCPGFKAGIAHLHKLCTRKRERQKDEDKEKETVSEDTPASLELLVNFHNLLVSLDQLQSSFLVNPEKYTDGELAIPPRRLVHTLRQLNPMYEGYLQHDAQEVLQCMLGYIQEACDALKAEYKVTEKSTDNCDSPVASGVVNEAGECSVLPKSIKTEEDDVQENGNSCGGESPAKGKGNGKRKNDSDIGNPKKKSKSLKMQKLPVDNKHFTRSKRKSLNDNMEGNESESDGNGENASAKPGKKTKRPKLGWLMSSSKQPTIFSRFRSVGKLTTNGNKPQEKEVAQKEASPEMAATENGKKLSSLHEAAAKLEEKKPASEEELHFNLLQRLFQGQLVLRTRCLECECYTERREDFQDISVPVQENESHTVQDISEISPDPKMELKTLKWAISQFASVERIVGEDKYFCETCHHYTEAERSLLFDKTPEVVTIHLKCFAANTSEFDPYAGLSKVNTPLQTPLLLSLDEWCTKPSKQPYELFAVVMHSGVTISSGHYTTYVKMMDLQNLNKDTEGSVRLEPLDEREARSFDPQDYDDGEVSFSMNSNSHNPSNKGNAKKSSDSIGLLGGQRSISSFEMGGTKVVNPEKQMGVTTEAEHVGQNVTNGLVDDAAESNKENVTAHTSSSPADCAERPSHCSLTDYEGKWLLFDDSEVRLVEEGEFLSSCSPISNSTSTPYLLFYKKSSPC